MSVSRLRPSVRPRHHRPRRRTMNIKTLIALGVALVVPLGAGVALANDPPPPPVASTLLACGTADELNIRDRTTGVKLVAGRPTDVALVRATIVAGGQTGWHAHPGPSFIIVTSGTLTIRAAHRRHCMEQGFDAGDVFAHPDGVHNFIAGAEGVEFTSRTSCLSGRLRC